MDDPLMVAYWKGRRIDDLSRDELVEAINQLAYMWEAERQQHMRSVRIISDLHSCTRRS